MNVVSAWIDHPKLGCGERQFVVLKEGRKKVRLLAWATLTTVTLTVDDYRRARPRPVPVEPRDLARRLSTVRRRNKRLGLKVGGAEVVAAIADLAGASASSA